MDSEVEEKAILCPAVDCEQPIEKGSFYSSSKSTWCDRWDRHVHSHCSGTFILREMDILTLRCSCHCHQQKNGSYSQKGNTQ